MTASASYLIGVDTGGTYTDAAIIEAEDHKVIASAKALTTKGDLAVGVGEAIDRAIASLPRGIAPADIALVSVSTTLATNAVVEGHGSSAGVLLIGFDEAMAERSGIARAFPGMPVARIPGGHDHNGDALQSLDAAAVEKAVAAMGADAYAIASAFAVRNPAHEHEARRIVHALTGRPVTLSTELTSALDAPRRALTAVLNARLISSISRLIDAVGRAMSSLGISCPLMIVKGDGTLALAQSVAARPIETILSGPAASLVGAAWLSGLSDFILSDIGGTTTDVGVLAGGLPRVAAEGASVGGWRTMVKAIDVQTTGLGGDSDVSLALDGRMTLGPGRVVPISLIGERYPETLAVLEGDLANAQGGSLLGRFVLLPFGDRRSGEPKDLSERERQVLATVTERPRPLRRIAPTSGAQRTINSLKRRGLIQVAGFTPSDAAHVLGFQDNWSARAAELAARVVYRNRTMKDGTPEAVAAFCREVWSETVRRSASVILDTAFGRAGLGGVLTDAACRGEPEIGLAKVSFTPQVPVVAVGGPARIYYDEVGRRLGCEIVYPPFCDVANAVGAATGVVARSITATVEGDGRGVFRIYGPEGVTMVTDGAAALDRAKHIASEAALSAALAAGADAPDIRINIEKDYLPDAVDESGLLRAAVTADAVGRPTFRASF